MEERLKQRLIGGAVLISLVVIFVPMLLEERVVSEQNFSAAKIPDKPKMLQRAEETHSIMPKPIARMEPIPTESPEQKIEVDEPGEEKPATAIPGQTTPAAAWMVQVASFSRQENAERLVDELKHADMPAQVNVVRINHKQLYRVQMLPQLDKQEAEDLVKRIQKKFGLEASVVRYAG